MTFTSGADPASPRRGSRLGRVLVAAVVIALVILVTPPIRRALMEAWGGKTRQPERPAVATAVVSDRPINEFALAPDGQRLAFTATATSGERYLAVRSLSAVNERIIEGTEGASHPFWSDDSRFIAYFANGRLRKVVASGGMSSVIADGDAESPGAWSGDVIVFSRDAAGGPLYRVSPDGGAPEPATILREGEMAHGWPVFLPGGERFLYTVVTIDGDSAVHARALDGSESREVLADASRVLVADSYVVYIREKALTVQPFDLELLVPRGDPIQVSEGHPASGGEGVRAFSLSSAGVLAYQIGDSEVSLIDWRTDLQR